MGDSNIRQRDDFISQLVDLFNRSNKTNAETIKFKDLTNYLIEHEIEHYTTNATSTNMLYEETKIEDKSKHNNEIEKIYYFSSSKIDKVVLFETNMKVIKVYDAVKMIQEKESTITCPGIINAIEFLPDRNSIAISLSDHTIRFYELKSVGYRFQRTLHVPSTQLCMAYVKRRKKELLFSGGVQSAIFCWNIEQLFSVEYELKPGDPGYILNNDDVVANSDRNKN